MTVNCTWGAAAMLMSSTVYKTVIYLALYVPLCPFLCRDWNWCRSNGCLQSSLLLRQKKTSCLADVGDTQGLIHHCSNYLTNVLCFTIVTMLFLQPVVYLLFIMHLSCSSLAVYVQQDLSAQQYALVLTVISFTAKLYLESTLKKMSLWLK